MDALEQRELVLDHIRQAGEPVGWSEMLDVVEGVVGVTEMGAKHYLHNLVRLRVLFKASKSKLSLNPDDEIEPFP